MENGPLFRQLFDTETFTYTYLLADAQTKEGMIIDPVQRFVDRDLGLLSELGIQLKWVLETHVHADHITSAHLIREKTGAKIGLGKMTGVKNADRLFSDGEKIPFGSLSLTALSTPGHTDGCTSYYMDGKVFTGDALMIRGCGRTDFQEGSSEILFKSVREKLFSLPDETLVYPAHDYMGRTCSSIGEEKKFNPRLKMTNTVGDFVQIMKNLKLEDPKQIKIAVPANLNCGRSS